VYKTELLKKKNRMHTFDTFFCCRKKQDNTQKMKLKKGNKKQKTPQRQYKQFRREKTKTDTAYCR
jgi:hypothetical protein